MGAKDGAGRRRRIRHRRNGKRALRRSDGTAGGARRPHRLSAAALAAALAIPVGSGASGQEQRPAVGLGVPLLVVPVQSVAPAPGGMLPGGAGSRTEALSRASAELDFAVEESEGTGSWVGPGSITERAAKNPLLGTDPARLPVTGLERVEVGKGRVPDPLHGQLRGLAALTGARLVLVPTRLAYRAARDSTARVSGEGASGEEGVIPEPGRAVLHATLLDARAGRVLWRGEVHGQAAPAESSAAVATAAANLVRYLAP